MWSSNWLYKRPPESLVSDKAQAPEVKSTCKSFHEALIDILDKRNVTEENIRVLDENQSTIWLQTILNQEAERIKWEETKIHPNTLHQRILDIKSRIIESFVILEIPFAISKRGKQSHVSGDWRVIEVNSVMISALKEKIGKKLSK